jgi:hypothetical protein
MLLKVDGPADAAVKVPIGIEVDLKCLFEICLCCQAKLRLHPGTLRSSVMLH